MISIIIPVFNGELTIGQTIKSILDQDYSLFEIIVVDDGSTDNTKQVVEKFNDNRITLLRQTNSRQGAARNAGLSVASGELVIFVDADDVISKKLLEEIHLKFKEDETVCIIYYDIIRKYDGGSKRIKFDTSLIDKVARNLPSKIIGAATPCNAAFSTNFIKSNNIQFQEKVYFEDISFMVDTLQNSRKIGYINNEYYQYNIRNHSTVRSSDVQVNQDVIHNFRYLLSQPKLNKSFKKELEFLAIKYILFEASLRTLNALSVSNDESMLFENLVSFYKSNFGNPKLNNYFKEESIIFKIIVYSSYRSRKKVLTLINAIRRLLK